MKDIFPYIDDHLNESIAELTELCKLASVSAQGSAMEETAEHVAGLLRRLGFEVRILPKHALSGAEGSAGGQPVIYAQIGGVSAKTLLFYNHYDV
ncbi:MAG: hypothetical protein V3V35_09070, partial [Dehalococcoidia bacterium]